MVQFYTPLKTTDTINHTTLNAMLQELSDAVDGVLDGSLTQTPDILDFLDAVHDHEDAAGGGLLTLAALQSGLLKSGHIITSDGVGGASMEETLPYTLRLLADTPNSYAGLALQALRVNVGEDGIDTAVYEGVEHTAYTSVNYQTTSTTFVDVDEDNFALEIDTDGEDIIVGFSANCFNVSAPNLVFFDLDIDGNRVGGDDGIIAQQFVAVHVLPVFFVRRVALSAGSHTIKLQWKVNADTGRLYSSDTTGFSLEVHPQLFAMKKVGL